MKTSIAFLAAFALTDTQAFAPALGKAFVSPTALSMAKYNTMDEILAKFPDDMPVLMNFYDAATEADIKSDIVRAKNLLKDRCTVVSVKQQDYPELAKKWDADTKTPSMILFKDGNPVTRIYEQSFYLDVVAKVGKYCRADGEEHKEIKK